MIIDIQILTIKRRQETEEGSDAEIEKGKKKQTKKKLDRQWQFVNFFVETIGKEKNLRY